MKIYSNKILKVAESWLGTNFHFYGRIKINRNNRGGVDCIGLIIKIGEEINSSFQGKNIIKYDRNDYSRFSHNSELKSFLDKYFLSISIKDLKAGDILYFNFDNGLEHVAIVSKIGIIHCYIEVGCVVEHILNKYWKDKIKYCYRYPNN